LKKYLAKKERLGKKSSMLVINVM